MPVSYNVWHISKTPQSKGFKYNKYSPNELIYIG